MSSDFRHFGKVEVVVSTGANMPPSHLFYTNGKTTLPGIADNHVMFPWIWELESDGGSTWLLSSADGVFWSKVPGGPVIPPYDVTTWSLPLMLDVVVEQAAVPEEAVAAAKRLTSDDWPAGGAALRCWPSAGRKRW